MGEKLPRGGEGGAERRGRFLGVFCTSLGGGGREGKEVGLLWREGQTGWAKDEPQGESKGSGDRAGSLCIRAPKGTCMRNSRIVILTETGL